MSLLVLDSDAVRAGRLAAQLGRGGYDTICHNDAQIALELVSQGAVSALICCNPQLFSTSGSAGFADRNRLPVGIATIAVSYQSIAVEDISAWLAVGVNDFWLLSEDLLDQPEFPFLGRLVNLLERMHMWSVKENSELVNMRAELERDQRAGQYIQMGMLPPNPMGIGHYRLQHKVEPSLLLSGDFVDYFQLTDQYFACYVADVAGHGASSAFVTVLLKNFSRRLRREYRHSMLTNPGEVLAWINSELLEQQLDKHVAMFLAIIDTKNNRLHFSNAAHFPPAIIVNGGNNEVLEQKGKPLGLFPGLECPCGQADFPPGARLVVFSDGVLDLLPGENLEHKERALSDLINTEQNLDKLWSHLDLTKLGADDVSCLFVDHEV